MWIKELQSVAEIGLNGLESMHYCALRSTDEILRHLREKSMILEVAQKVPF